MVRLILVDTTFQQAETYYTSYYTVFTCYFNAYRSKPQRGNKTSSNVAASRSTRATGKDCLVTFLALNVLQALLGLKKGRVYLLKQNISLNDLVGCNGLPGLVASLPVPLLPLILFLIL